MFSRSDKKKRKLVRLQDIVVEADTPLPPAQEDPENYPVEKEELETALAPVAQESEDDLRRAYIVFVQTSESDDKEIRIARVRLDTWLGLIIALLFFTGSLFQLIDDEELVHRSHHVAESAPAAISQIHPDID